MARLAPVAAEVPTRRVEAAPGDFQYLGAAKAERPGLPIGNQAPSRKYMRWVSPRSFMVIMGTRGMGSTEQPLRSIARQVIQLADLPVTLVKWQRAPALASFVDASAVLAAGDIDLDVTRQHGPEPLSGRASAGDHAIRALLRAPPGNGVVPVARLIISRVRPHHPN